MMNKQSLVKLKNTCTKYSDAGMFSILKQQQYEQNIFARNSSLNTDL